MRTALLIVFISAGALCAADGPGKARLWKPSADLPASAEAPAVENVRFELIERHNPDEDGYPWLHGIALAWHEGRLFATYGLNSGGEREQGDGSIDAHGEGVTSTATGP